MVKTANWLTHLEYDWESPIWRPWLELLADGRRLLRYDQRGSGLSDRQVREQGLERWVEDLEAVVDAAGVGRFVLFGMSQGGPIAIAYATRHPERVTGLLLYGTYARGQLKRDSTPQQAEETRLLNDLIRLGWGRATPEFRNVFGSLFLPEGTSQQLQWFDELQRRSASADDAARIVGAFDRIDVTQLASRVQVPTLVLHARHDRRIPFEEGRMLAAIVPGARFVPLDSQNHVLLKDETAWSEFERETRAFLAECAEDGMGRVDLQARLHLSEPLTRREMEILGLLAQGLGNADIAALLSLSPSTVRNHVTSIFAKLGVRNRAEAVVRAHAGGIGLPVSD